jgi:hypothetical protein
MSESSLKIENQERIHRILSRICDAKLNLLIRSHLDPTTAVRGRASQLTTGSLGKLTIFGLSEMGLTHLSKSPVVRVEFCGMSTQVSFDCRIIGHDPSGGISVSLPTSITNTERRRTARFHTTDLHSAFLSLSAKPLEVQNDWMMPSFFKYSGEAASWLRIVDISEGGICAMSRFPGVLSTFTKGFTDPRASIIFPMSLPIETRMEMRWIKRIKEKNPNSDIGFARKALIGFEFRSQSEDLILKIRQFVREMNLSSAI